MIRETRDVAEIEWLARSLWFAEAAHGEAWTSLAPMIADDRNIVLKCDDERGAFICRYQDPCTYVIQRLFPNDMCSGTAASTVIHWVFTRTPCLRLVHEGWTLRLSDWMHHDQTLPIVGRDVRMQLQGSNVAITANEAFDRCIGAAVSMIRGGQVAKGIAVYNGCASLQGLSAARAICERPPRIDLGGSVLCIDETGVFFESEAGSAKPATIGVPMNALRAEV